MSSTKYTPTREDIAWVRRVLACIKDGGTIAMPYSGQIWKVDHTAKTVTLMAGPKDKDIEKHRAVFAVEKYTVYTETPIKRTE